jgi:hypothetical protein
MNDDTFAALLDLLNKHREMIREIVFHPDKIPPSLTDKAGRKLLSGPVSATEFLTYIAKPADGHPIGFCYADTKSLCAKGTLCCVGGTKPNEGKRGA